MRHARAMRSTPNPPHLKDQPIQLISVRTLNTGPHLLYRIEGLREDICRILMFITNYHRLGANRNTITAIDKKRW